MHKELAQKLSSEVDECDWSMLEIHQKRGAVLVIDQQLDLVETAAFIATDNLEKISEWHFSGKLRKPTENEILEWDKDKYKKFAKFLIIQPYVLIQCV